VQGDSRQARYPAKGTLGGQSIRELVEAGEKTGNVDALFGDFIRHNLSRPQIDAAFRAVLRVSAHGMLQDDLDQAKFGWSHCLTLPQSAFGLSSVTRASQPGSVALTGSSRLTRQCGQRNRPLDVRSMHGLGVTAPLNAM
jgi:hypothetical protein